MRASHILSFFTLASPVWRVSDLARALELPVATVHGIVKTMEMAGFLSQDPATREYGLGLRLLELGAIQAATLPLNQKVSLPAGYLARELGLTVQVGILDHDSVLLTLATPSEGGLPLSLPGARLPAYCTALGRAMLAFRPPEEAAAYLGRVNLLAHTPRTLLTPDELCRELAAVRERGYAQSFQELMVNLDSLAAPLFGPGGRVLGALGITGSPAKVSGGQLVELAHRLMTTASEISGFLGYALGAGSLGGGKAEVAGPSGRPKRR